MLALLCLGWSLIRLSAEDCSLPFFRICGFLVIDVFMVTLLSFRLFVGLWVMVNDLVLS
jgi:hypothetical protein